MHCKPRLTSTIGLLSVFGLLLLSSGCATYKAVQRLSPDEQTEFRVYRHLMNGGQTRTYLAKATAAERTAYLNEIGVAQKVAALDPKDRKAIRAGHIRKGMSAEALRVLWGEPHDEQGYAGHHETWFYKGSVPDLNHHGKSYSDVGTRVEVFLLDGKVSWWHENVYPNGLNDNIINRRVSSLYRPSHGRY